MANDNTEEYLRSARLSEKKRKPVNVEGKRTPKLYDLYHVNFDEWTLVEGCEGLTGKQYKEEKKRLNRLPEYSRGRIAYKEVK